MQRLSLHHRPLIDPVLQSEAAECGLACLVMVVGYHGHRVTLSELRRRHAVSLKGTTLKTLIAIADTMGFTGRPLRLDLDDLSKLKRPCILHWDLTHYVVLSRVSSRWVEVQDPASGLQRLSLAEVSKHFTGVALELTPAANFQKRTTVERVRLADLWSKAAGFIPSLIQILALSALLELFGLVSPLVNQMIVDNAIAKGDLDLLNIIVIGAGLLLLIQAGTTLLRGYVQMHFGTLLTFQMRGNLLRHALRLPVPWFEKRRLGDIVSRFNSLQPVQDLLTGGVISVALDGVMAIITLAVMFVYSPLLAGVVFTSLTLFVSVRLGTFPWLRRLTNEGIQYQAKVDSILLETIRGARTFRLFGRERERHAVWQNAYAESVNNNIRTQKIGMHGAAGLSILSGAETLLVFYLGAQAVIAGDMTLGMLLAFQSYRGQFGTATQSLVTQYFKFRMLGLHLERLADAIHQDPEAGLAHEMGERGRALSGSLAVRGLSFRYAEHEPWVLRDVDLTIRPGEFIAFVGPSGGGKSTLLKLLMGLYPPTEGDILVDNLPLSTVGLRSYREHIGVVMQDDQLFAGTIADNIAFFDPEMDLERVEEVAKLAALHDEITRMPMGYMTLVGDLGSTLSGGQRQRVLLARAMYRQPTFLFLDEGTANLDMLAERKVMRAFADLSITRVVVAHRSTAIMGAHRIFAVEGGRIQEVSAPAAAATKAVQTEPSA
ncbi:peptidase domain-containing ABC transporter [Nitrospirillum pindoramense]|uniref:ATP-binding cassette subfamily B protein RaxB n=1 Tax=Nitrospirillum amazonense TaxID=28077 RepID=A0A560HDP8_9PROT|nr:peptidase domain-containing ABC transporter [Nitrospirillum amazonense]TWB44526.1 ATP-binding cassette subfamily B protein RaxB [Nitrospirillum amazonense]